MAAIAAGSQAQQNGTAEFGSNATTTEEDLEELTTPEESTTPGVAGFIYDEEGPDVGLIVGLTCGSVAALVLVVVASVVLWRWWQAHSSARTTRGTGAAGLGDVEAPGDSSLGVDEAGGVRGGDAAGRARELRSKQLGSWLAQKGRYVPFAKSGTSLSGGQSVGQLGELQAYVQQLESHMDLYRQNYAQLEESNKALPRRSQSSHAALLQEWQQFHAAWKQAGSAPQRSEAARPCEAEGLSARFRMLLADYQETWLELFPGQGIEEILPLPLHLVDVPESPLQEEASLLQSFAHPLLTSLALKPYGVLGLDERQAGLQPLAPLEAVVVAPAEWHEPATGASKAVCQWLGLQESEDYHVVLPGAVEAEFSQGTPRVAGGSGRQQPGAPRAKYFAHGSRQHVIYVTSSQLTDVIPAVQFLSEAYRCILVEFCTAVQSDATKDAALRTLRLLPLCGASLMRRALRRHAAEITIASLCAAFVQLPPVLQETLRTCKLEFCVFRTHEYAGYLKDLESRCAAVSGKPTFSSDCGSLAPKEDLFKWVRASNSCRDRLARLGTMLHTAHAIAEGGYVLPHGEVALDVAASLKGTAIFRSSRSVAQESAADAADATPAGTAQGAREAAQRRLAFVEEATVMEAAAQSQLSGKATVAVNAASAYHVGGGATTGGRHALEEALCVMSTLLPSLQQAHWEQHVGQPEEGSGHQAVGVPHIPVDGCILTPAVEIFREPSDAGYSFQAEPTRLTGVCSVAMFNLNSRVRDSPVDAPVHFDEYCTGVKEKFRSVLEAAASVGAEVLVCPPVGCGVFGNDPKVVGSLFGEVLFEMPELTISQVVITGHKEFFDAALLAAAGGKPGNRLRPPAFFRAAGVRCGARGRSPAAWRGAAASASE